MSFTENLRYGKPSLLERVTVWKKIQYYCKTFRSTHNLKPHLTYFFTVSKTFFNSSSCKFDLASAKILFNSFKLLGAKSTIWLMYSSRKRRKSMARNSSNKAFESRALRFFFFVRFSKTCF